MSKLNAEKRVQNMKKVIRYVGRRVTHEVAIKSLK